MTDTTLLQQMLQVQIAGHNLALAGRQIEIRRIWAEELERPRNADPRRLLRYGHKVFSQCDEDGIIEEIFKRIGVTNRTFVEFGVENGNECNTTRLLIDGWNGLWLEGSEAHVAHMRDSLATYLGAGRLKVKNAMVTAENIDGLLQESEVTGEIDLLSIDVDFNDYWIWKAISAVSPRVVVIEYNATLKPPMSVTVPYAPTVSWDGTNYFGASLSALVKLGREKGYRIVGCSFSGANAFFVRDDLGHGKFLEPATAEEHYEPARYFLVPFSAGHRAKVGPYVAI